MTDVDLSTCEIQHGTYAPGVGIDNGGAQVAFRLDPLTLDPATSYTIEFDVVTAADTVVYLWSIQPGTFVDAYGVSNFYDLAASDTIPAGSSTVSLSIGPGLMDFDSAMTDGEFNVYVYAPHDTTVAAVRTTAGSGPTDPGDGIPEPAPVDNSTPTVEVRDRLTPLPITAVLVTL